MAGLCQPASTDNEALFADYDLQVNGVGGSGY